MNHIQTHIYQMTPNELKDDIIKEVRQSLKEFYEMNKTAKPENEELLTVQETMDLLKCSKQALHNWRKNGILPSYRMGNRVYYKKSEIYSKLIKQESHDE
ncbi:DNA-binding protein [Hanstruepera neustonica]|uniref:DNA-binding protein n=1 Tax=Hanstruepera neustonica TaxID=1445657 RepID=A0A2K1E4L5_9FLAO|nr:helix-turn-helix domain-containing protein [Hanstruepera neustonica]PNQ75203.1 DNA-binding protein [Hanstruepera neustonica]